MIKGRDKITVTPAPAPGDPPPYSFRAHVSWETSQAVTVNMVSGSYTTVSRYIRATYGAAGSIPTDATVEWLGQQFTAYRESPEEIHSGPNGEIHHKARQLKAAGE